MMLAAGGLGTLATLVIFVLLSWLNSRAQQAKDAEMGGWDDAPPSKPPPRPVDPKQRRKSPEIEDWEAELRRIVRDRPKQPLPPSFPRPPQPKVPPPPSEEGPDLEMPAPTASRRAMEEAQRLPEAVRARLQEASARLGQMAESRRAMAEGAGIETETAGEIRAGIAASLNLPRIPHDRPMHAEAAAVVQNLRTRVGVRQALLASLILGKPRALDPL